MRNRPFFVFLALAVLSLPLFAQYQYPFQNPNLPIEERVTNILKLMTLEEKIACLSTRPDVPRLGIKGAGHVEGLHGLALGGPGGWGRIEGPTGKRTIDAPVTTTQFPQAIGLGETWDPELVRQVAAVEGLETRYAFQQLNRGGLVVRAPNADLVRDPRWGRSEESYGEDAFFNGTMTVAFVKGLQGDHPRYWQTASLMKHFLANSNEDGRAHTSSNYDERLFREYYSVPFRMGILEGGSRAFMASYNATNGIPDHIQPFLKSVAVKEWGQDGIICTDGGGLKLLVTEHKAFKNLDEAAAAVIKAGIGQFLDDYAGATRSALKKGLLTEAEMDESLRGVFRVMIRLGLLDPPEMVPYIKIVGEKAPWDDLKQRDFVRLVTQESIVLLKNDGDLLPLDKRAIKSAAVIGPYADQVLLDWYSGTPPYTVSALDGIKNKLGPTVAVRFARNNDKGEALAAAKSADVAFVVVGNHPECNAGWDVCPLPSDGKESRDRHSITLEQEELVKAVQTVNPRTVVVLIASFPYALNWSQQHVPAIVHMTHNSQEAGNALADVLFGDFNPGGRLTETWPMSLDQLPDIMDYNIRHGRTYMYFKGQPLYPFGYGLSYTTFRYSNPRISAHNVAKVGVVKVTVDIENTGKRLGDEVVQLYASYPSSKVERPKQELKAFKRVTLKPGEKQAIELPVNVSSLAYWNEAEHRWVVESGKVELMVGRNASAIEFRQTINVQ